MSDQANRPRRRNHVRARPRFESNRATVCRRCTRCTAASATNANPTTKWGQPSVISVTVPSDTAKAPRRPRWTANRACARRLWDSPPLGVGTGVPLVTNPASLRTVTEDLVHRPGGDAGRVTPGEHPADKCCDERHGDHDQEQVAPRGVVDDVRHTALERVRAEPS